MIVITVARKPLGCPVVDNITKWGTGGLNIDESRVSYQSEQDMTPTVGCGSMDQKNPGCKANLPGYKENWGKWSAVPKGRFPSNIIFEHNPECEDLETFWKCWESCPINQLDIQSGNRPGMPLGSGPLVYGGGGGFDGALNRQPHAGFGDSGGASRFFKQIQYEVRMNVLSLFDGLSCGQIALNRRGIKVNKYFASEVDKYAIKVTQHNYPNTIQLGDVTKVFGKDLPKIDLLIGGSPCHGFSFAGKGLNFEDHRSKLFFEFVRLLKECKPKWFLLENVKMKKEYEYAITELLGVSCARINSNLVSAQNRNRLYWTNIPGDGNYTIGNFIDQPANKGILLRDILEKDQSLWRDSEEFPYRSDTPSSMDGKASCLRAEAGGKTKGIAIYNSNKTKYRLLTPLECERLQTVPEGYTIVPGVSNRQRYRMLGNGWTIDVITHILKGIKT